MPAQLAPPRRGRHVAELLGRPHSSRHVALPVARQARSPATTPRSFACRRGGAVSPRCFSADATRLILPAFGAYTGGLFASTPPLTRLLAPRPRHPHRHALRERPIAARVAEAGTEGGFLGFGGEKVSAAEKATLDRLASALG